MEKQEQQWIYLQMDTRKAQQVVYEVNGLNAGKHSISIINRGWWKVAMDALIVR